MALKGGLRRLTVGDWLVTGVMLLLGVVLLLASGRGDPGARVLVRVEDRTVFAAPLSGERHVEIPGPLGPTRVTIAGGRAYIEQASCPQHLCMRMGAVKHAGEMIACVPNRLLLTVEGGGEAAKGDYDFLSR